MPVTATDEFALHFVGVRTLLAASDLFQTEREVDTEAEALEYVYDCEAAEGARRPFFILIDYELQSERGSFYTSSCQFIFEREVPQNSNIVTLLDAETDFRNVLGQIMQEAYAISYDGGYMPLRAPIKLRQIQRCDPQRTDGQERPYYQALLTVEAGIRGS